MSRYNTQVLSNNAENPSSCILHFEDICIANNLIEYCGSGIHMGDYADMEIPGTKGYITNLTFENNLVMNSGMGWVRELVWRESGGSSASLSAFETNDSAIDNDGIYIRNNVFYKSGFSLFSLSDYHLDRTMQVNVDGFLRFADYFFDGLFADWAVLDKINQSQEQVHSTRRQIENVLSRLGGMQRSVEQEQNQLESKLDTLVRDAKI